MLIKLLSKFPPLLTQEIRLPTFTCILTTPGFPAYASMKSLRTQGRIVRSQTMMSYKSRILVEFLCAPTLQGMAHTSISFSVRYTDCLSKPSPCRDEQLFHNPPKPISSRISSSMLLPSSSAENLGLEERVLSRAYAASKVDVFWQCSRISSSMVVMCEQLQRVSKFYMGACLAMCRTV